MDALIPLINELQGVFKSTGLTHEINLPQIVVVGSQSCGKSSVLESLVRRSFLPRGSGIVTRCPIILQLTHITEEDEDGNEEWCIIKNASDGDKKYSDFDEVREAIENQTDIIAGGDRGISKNPIFVEVYSPNVLSLTVIDLPGVVKVAVEGQPEDIEQQVHDMILEYIKNPNSLILAVSPGNQDIATSDSIKMAKEVDPLGKRTVGVVTKLDLMDKGTNATKVLNGEVIQMELGIIGVVNRSQEDIDNQVSIEKALKNEKEYFVKNYPSFEKIGSQYLAKRLNTLLQNHIKNALPELVDRVKDLTNVFDEKLEKLGQPIAVDKIHFPWILTKVVTKFINEYESKVNCRNQFSLPQQEKDNSDPFLGPKVTNIFGEFGRTLKAELEKFIADLVDAKLHKLIQSTANIEGFTCIEKVFKDRAKEGISKMEKPSMECAEKFHCVLSDAVKESLTDIRLHKLNDEICRVTKKLLYCQLLETKRGIHEYFQIQTTMIFTQDENFLNLLKTSDPNEQRVAQGYGASFHLTSAMINSQIQCEYVRYLVSYYLDKMRSQVSDGIPKFIKFNLHDRTMEKIYDEITDTTAGKNELLAEDEQVVEQRLVVNAMLQNLHQAFEIVNGIESTM